MPRWYRQLDNNVGTTGGSLCDGCAGAINCPYLVRAVFFLFHPKLELGIIMEYLKPPKSCSRHWNSKSRKVQYMTLQHIYIFLFKKFIFFNVLLLISGLRWLSSLSYGLPFEHIWSHVGRVRRHSADTLTRKILEVKKCTSQHPNGLLPITGDKTLFPSSTE